MKLHLLTSIRTNNFTDDEMMAKIKSMWEEASSKLENNEECVYGVYYDYENNYKGDYSLSVAIEREGNNGLAFIEIPDNKKYEIFKVDMNDEQGILKAWSTIWKQEETGTLRREYSYDFEKYYPNGEIEIYIAVK